MKNMTPKDLVTVRELYSLVDEKMSSIEERLGRVEVKQAVLQETMRNESRNAAAMYSTVISIVITVIGALVTFYLRGGGQ